VHKAQIARFTAWFAAKRNRQLGDLNSGLEEFKSDLLSEDDQIFTCEHVQRLLHSYQEQVAARYRDELDQTAKLSAVYMAELFRQAEAHGLLNLQAGSMDTIEDQGLVNQVAALSTMGSMPPLPKRESLQPVGPALGAGTDIALLQQLDELKEEKRQLAERNQLVQAELVNISRERSELTAEVARLQDVHMQTAGASSADAIAAQQYLRQLQETQAAYDAKAAENEQIRREYGQRLADSSQFRQLKEIVKQKNVEVQDYKQRLISAGLMLPEADGGGHVELADDSD